MEYPIAWGLAIIVCLGMGIGLGVTKGCEEPPPPKPCADYSYKISRMPFNAKVAMCDAWSNMDMKLEKMGILGGQMVHCSCP